MANAIARATRTSLVGHGVGHRIGPRSCVAARDSQSTSPAPRRSWSPHELRPLALKSAPAKTGRHCASGINWRMRSAANQEYGDHRAEEKQGHGHSGKVTRAARQALARLCPTQAPGPVTTNVGARSTRPATGSFAGRVYGRSLKKSPARLGCVDRLLFARPLSAPARDCPSFRSSPARGGTLGSVIG